MNDTAARGGIAPHHATYDAVTYSETGPVFD